MSDCDYPALDASEIFGFGARRKTAGVVAGVHWLIVDGADWEVRHEPGCKQERWIDGPDGLPLYHHTCAVGAYVNEFGLDMLEFPRGRSAADLPPGCYQIEAWWRTYPSTPDHAEEHDGGLQFSGELPVGPAAEAQF